MEGADVPTGDEYEPGEQVKKAKKPGVTDSEGVVKNIIE